MTRFCDAARRSQPSWLGPSYVYSYNMYTTSYRCIYRPSKALSSPDSWLLQWAWLHRCAAPTACSGHAVSCLSGRSGWMIRRQYMRINHGSHLYFCCNFSPGAWRAGVRALVLDFPGSMAGTATGCGVSAPARMAAVDTISLCNTSESLELQQLQQLAARTPQPPLPPCLIALRAQRTERPGTAMCF